MFPHTNNEVKHIVLFTRLEIHAFLLMKIDNYTACLTIFGWLEWKMGRIRLVGMGV